MESLKERELNFVSYLLDQDGMCQVNLIGPVDCLDSLLEDQLEGALFSSPTEKVIF